MNTERKVNKAIIMAAGKGTRLSPMPIPISKILLPVYDRPMLYYPLAALMEAGIRDILVITSAEDGERFQRCFGDGSALGINLSYKVQAVQKGIADAFIIGEDFIGDDNVVLILGDNLFIGKTFNSVFSGAIDSFEKGACIFGYNVPDPRAFGVIEFDRKNNVISLEEKPARPKSNCAAIGLYILDKRCIEYAKSQQPSARDELEITDLCSRYMDDGELSVCTLNEDVIWMDMGTFDSFLDAGMFVRTLERKRGRKIQCPEIIAVEKKYVTKRAMAKTVDGYKKNAYTEAIRSYIGI